MELNAINVYNPNDYVLLVNPSDSTKSSENQCPLCQYIIKGSSDKCFLHQSISNDYILPILVLLIIVLDVWWSHKEKTKK